MANHRAQTPVFTVRCDCGDTFTATADELVEVADTHICPLAPADDKNENDTGMVDPNYEDFIAEEVAGHGACTR